ncbi:MAG: anaerobic ribonucleoside-triphosphate reductase activating protein [Synergistaceae bacterium]|nr:anaerobic ribonucleoside-triphosphate reductase activating protein [Synergistaceae bacterium]
MKETRETLRLAGITDESIVDGPGLRYVVFVQGCPHRCAGCHNPQTHDPAGGYEIGGGELVSRFQKTVRDNPLICGVTLSGGEPFAQARALLPFARLIPESGLDLWIYTGWMIEEILSRLDPYETALLECADALVDGRFEAGGRTLEIPFVGSVNQRIIRRGEIKFLTDAARPRG